MRRKYVSHFMVNSAIGDLIGHLDVELLEVGFAGRRNRWDQRQLTEDPYHRLYCLMAGAGAIVTLNGRFELTARKTYFIPAGLPFRYHCEQQPPAHYWVHFRSEALRRLGAFEAPLELDADTGDDFEALLVAGMERDFAAIAARDVAMRKLLLRFLESHRDDASGVRDCDVFTRTLEFIRGNLKEKMTTPQLAKRAAMNRNEFSRRFRQTFGLAPRDYIIRERVNQAKLLLLSTEQTVKQIAFQVGFTDEFFFYRTFKRVVALTPTDYRQANNLSR